MENTYITIIKRNRVTRIEVGEILLVERKGRKLLIHTKDEVIDYYEKMENVIPLLDERFYPCLQGCYVNFNHITDMIDREISFDNGESFSIGRANFIKTRQNFILYLKKTYKDVKNACNFNEISI